MGPPALGEERAERTDLGMDLVESFRKSDPEPGEARFRAVAARATCEAEGIGGVCVPDSP